MSEAGETGAPSARNLLEEGDNAVYLKGPVTSVDEAVERMDEVTRYIEAYDLEPQLDGLACFNYLYTVITKHIRTGINEGFFQDPVFLTQLDIVFANRYFDALRAAVTPGAAVPKAWSVLLDRRDIRRIEPMQFAVAGVNAHINLDLAVAVVDTCTALRTEPNSGTQRSDYQAVNRVFAEEMQGLRQHYEGDFQRAIDRAASPVLDLVCNWSVVAFRNAAWERAEHLWRLRRMGAPEDSFVERLDRFAALTGELLLSPRP